MCKSVTLLDFCVVFSLCFLSLVCCGSECKRCESRMPRLIDKVIAWRLPVVDSAMPTTDKPFVQTREFSSFNAPSNPVWRLWLTPSHRLACRVAVWRSVTQLVWARLCCRLGAPPVSPHFSFPHRVFPNSPYHQLISEPSQPSSSPPSPPTPTPQTFFSQF